MTEKRKMAITYMQSQCMLGYSQYAKISTQECARLFDKYNLFEFISACYEVLQFDTIDYIVRNDIRNRIKNKIPYVNNLTDCD